jgi:DNA-binding GntR family transcriptional regulator
MIKPTPMPEVTSNVDAPNSRRTRSDDVYRFIKQDITQFRMLPGDRFTELELSERLGVSRTPIRQALHRLKQEGHLEVFFRSGWRVLPFDFKKFEQLYELRQILETSCIRILCSQGHRGGLDAMQALSAIWLVPEEERMHNGDQVQEMDEAFHCALVAAAGNDEITKVHQDITEKIRIVRRLDFTQTQRVQATYHEHGMILKAILGRRPEQANMLLKAHILASESEVKKITLHQLHSARNMVRTPSTLHSTAHA